MPRSHRFAGSVSAGPGYFAYNDTGKLVIGENSNRESQIVFVGTYDSCPIGMLNKLHKENTKLYNSIVQYYDKTISYQFADSRDLHGNGWYGWIEDGQLVIGHEAPREGGILFRGTYEEAADKGWLATLLREDQRLYHDIDRYFIKHGAEPKVPIKEKTNSPAGVLWKVKLYMANTEAPIVYVQVRGLNEACVINKLFPKVPEVLTLQTHDARVIAVRSDKISAAEFMPED